MTRKRRWSRTAAVAGGVAAVAIAGHYVIKASRRAVKHEPDVRPVSKKTQWAQLVERSMVVGAGVLDYFCKALLALQNLPSRFNRFTRCIFIYLTGFCTGVAGTLYAQSMWAGFKQRLRQLSKDAFWRVTAESVSWLTFGLYRSISPSASNVAKIDRLAEELRQLRLLALQDHDLEARLERTNEIARETLTVLFERVKDQEFWIHSALHTDELKSFVTIGMQPHFLRGDLSKKLLANACQIHVLSGGSWDSWKSKARIQCDILWNDEYPDAPVTAKSIHEHIEHLTSEYAPAIHEATDLIYKWEADAAASLQPSLGQRFTATLQGKDPEDLVKEEQLQQIQREALGTSRPNVERPRPAAVVYQTTQGPQHPALPV